MTFASMKDYYVQDTSDFNESSGLEINNFISEVLLFQEAPFSSAMVN